MNYFIQKKLSFYKHCSSPKYRIELRKQLFSFATSSENSDIPTIEEVSEKPIHPNDVGDDLKFLSNISDNEEYWEEVLKEPHVKNKFYMRKEDELAEGSDKETIRPDKQKSTNRSF